MRKLLIFLRLHWLKILLLGLIGFLTLILILCFYFGIGNFMTMESYSRRQLLSQLPVYLIVGIIQAFIFVALSQAFHYYFFLGGGMASMGQDKIRTAKGDVTWADIVGMEKAKKEALEIVEILKDKFIRHQIGGSVIKGAILVGPPGCGKTYLAKAIATESGLPFISAVGSEFVGILVGQGSIRMKNLFKEARSLAQMHEGCIIFIDEIDSFARSRHQMSGMGGAEMSHTATVNQFLTEIDGLRRKDDNIVILAATNVPEEELDPAIMRSGRFDRKIYIDKPNDKERAELFKHYLAKVKTDETINYEKLSEKALWCSPSDINNIVREAGILALRQKRSLVTMPDVEAAIERILESVEKVGKQIGQEKILSAKVNIAWDEVIGMDTAKKEAWEIVKLLKDRHLLKMIGGKIIKGTLLIGPPGCGKTYLAKAIATESGLPFFSAVGSEFVGTLVGHGADRIRALFKEARSLAKVEGGCIVFIDEIDSFARPRISLDSGAGMGHNATINQFLTELDGLRQQENNIVVLAATNVPEEELDPAIMRAGRFDRKIYVNRPNLQERHDLFKFYASRVQLDPGVDINILARKALWFSPSDIDSMIREAGIIASRDKRAVITMKDLSEAYDRVRYGTKSNIQLNEKERIWVAYHEAGHAIIGYMLHPTDDVIKASIIPHRGSLGFVAPSPKEEIYVNTKDQYLAEIKRLVASFAAEKIKFGTTGSGVSGDFQRAMKCAYNMVYSWGMGPSGLLGDFNSMISPYGRSMISEKTKERLDDDAQKILQECLKEVTEILTAKRDVLDYFAQELLRKGELEYDEIQAIFEKFGIKPARPHEV